MPHKKLLRTNARGLILGGSDPYNKTNLTTDPTLIYAVSIPATVPCITKGMLLNFQGTSGDTATVTVALANYKGKVIRRSVQTSTVALAVATEDDQQLLFPFRHEVRLKDDRSYFALVQVLSVSGEDAIIGWSNEGSLSYPLSTAFAGTLTALKHFVPPTTYTDSTAVAGNLY
jgi:hypothetical protein